MTARRAAVQPPELPGYQYKRALGSGGHADVHVYEQQSPRRPVAVKVLRAETLTPELLAQFRFEADVMAQLSQHPAIVTIHQAGQTADGRPYLVMEYCSRPGYGERFRTEKLPVDEVLRVGVRLASAVESAHRAGVMHRDIKPANVLTTDFGWPALTDFGIASSAGDGAPTGMSIPWAPPEALDASRTPDARADIYSLGATLYSLLAGRSPFETPGHANSDADLMSRIENDPVPPIGRSDVPAALSTLLAKAMAKSPQGRPSSAHAFARQLQRMEEALGLAPTAIEVSEYEPPAYDAEEPAAPAAPVVDDAVDDSAPTRVRPVITIDPDAAAAASGWSSAEADEETRAAVGWSSALADEETRAAVGWSSAVADDETRAAPAAAAPAPAEEDLETRAIAVSAPQTAARATVPAPAPAAADDDAPTVSVPSVSGREQVSARSVADAVVEQSEKRPRRSGGRRFGRRPALVAIAVVSALVIGGGVAGIVAAATLSPPATSASDKGGKTDPAVSSTPVPSPQKLAGKAGSDGSVAFTWTNPEPKKGDQFLWTVTGDGVSPAYKLTGENTITVPAAQVKAGTPTCVEVSLVRADRRASTQPARACEG